MTGATPSPSPTVSIRTAVTGWASATAQDVSAHPLWVLLVAAAIVASVLGVVFVARVLKYEPKVITDEPPSLFHYLADTWRKHYLSYCFFTIVPVAVGIFFKVNILNLFGIWGFLVTSLSAFYATRADVASNRALTASKEALAHAKQTYNAVVEFADSLEMFNDNVRYRLEGLAKREERISLKFLTVVPAFGDVGLDTIYETRRVNGQRYDDLPRFICSLVQQQVHREKYWNIEILTHDYEQVRDWLTNIYETSEPNGTDREALIEQKYLAQRQFVAEFETDLVVPRYGRMRFWRPNNATLSGLNLAEGGPRPKIPFQFLLVKRYMDLRTEDGVSRDINDINDALNQELLRVFFLFSGDFLYDFVFKVFKGKVDMLRLQQLTKGYYTDDKDLLRIFSNIFWNFSKRMPRLEDSGVDTYFPPV